MTERRIEFADGATTVLEQWGGRGPVMLCVHGITSSRRAWSRLGEGLRADYRVFAYDQRGHGDAANAPGPLTLERSEDDLAVVAGALPAPVDVLVGHSWGGAIALLGGRRIAPRKVLAIDPMIRVVPGTFEREYVDDVREMFALEAGARDVAIRETYAGAYPADVAGKLHAMLPMSIETLERLGRDNRVDDDGWDLRDRLVDYPVPLAVFAAGVDSVMSPEDVAFLRARGGPNVRITTFEGEGHNLQRTAFEAFARALVAFAA